MAIDLKDFLAWCTYEGVHVYCIDNLWLAMQCEGPTDHMTLPALADKLGYEPSSVYHCSFCHEAVLQWSCKKWVLLYCRDAGRRKRAMLVKRKAKR